jgi:hypothetical protein
MRWNRPPDLIVDAEAIPRVVCHGLALQDGPSVIAQNAASKPRVG